jgi:hypothetical protein
MAQRWSASQRKFIDDGVRVVDPDGDHPELDGRAAPTEQSADDGEQDPRESTAKRAAAGTRKSTKQ